MSQRRRIPERIARALGALALALGAWLASLSATAGAHNEAMQKPVGNPPEKPEPPVGPCPPGQCATPEEDCCHCGDQNSAGGQIDLFNGREFRTWVDLEVPGIYPIHIVREYDSHSRHDSPLGYGWSLSLDYRLFRHTDGSISIRGSCGGRQRFIFSGGGYQPQGAKTAYGPRLSESSGTFTLQWSDGSKAVFLATDDSRLSYVENVRGHRLQFTYSATKMPISGTSPFASSTTTSLVTSYQYQILSIEEVLKSGTSTWHPTGRKVNLTYNNSGGSPTGRLTQVTTFDGRYVKYAHDGDGNLTSVRRSVDGVAANDLVATYTYTTTATPEGGDRHNLKTSIDGQNRATVTRLYDSSERIYRETEGTRQIDINYHDGQTDPIKRTLTTTIDNDGSGTPYTTTTVYEYDANGLPIRTTDPMGNVTETVRDPATGAVLEVRSYWKQGSMLTLTRTIRTVPDALGNVTRREVIEPNGDRTVTSYIYDPSGLTANQSWVSVEESYATQDMAKKFRTEYDFLRPCGHSGCAPAAVTRVRRFKDTSNYLDTQFVYGTGPNFELEKIILPDNHEIGLTYFGLTTAPSNPTTSADFLAISKMGRVNVIQHQPGGTPVPELKTTYAYDEAGFVASITRPVDATQGDAVTQYLRDDIGRVAQLTDALSNLIKATFTDHNGTNPGELLTLLEVGATGSAKGRRQKLVYDSRGRLLEVQRCTDYASTCGTFKLFRKFGYDSEGNRLWAEDYSEDSGGTLIARRTKLFYDLGGRLKEIEDPATKLTQFEYDERANLTKRTDALSRVTQWAYDGLDRLIQEISAISGTTALAYDAAGNVVRVTDPVGSKTDYAHDGLSRLLSVKQSMGETVQYAWDSRDRLQKKVLARSVTGGSSEHPEIRYTYEAWGPLKDAKHYAKSSDTTPIKTITYARNRAGNLISVTDDAIQSGALYIYTVDKLGRTTNATAKYLPGGDRPIDHTYDARGDRTSMVLTDGSETLTHSYGYSTDSGLLNSATFPSSGTALTITRWPHDGVKVITYPGGVHRDVTYLSRGPVDSIKVFPPSGGTPLDSWTYAYTDVLNVDMVTDQASRITDYGYDNLDRLTSVSHPTMPSPLNTLPSSESFSYDGVGNRTMSGYAHDANHRMRASPSKTYDYDDDGNLTARDPGSGQATYTWDLSNQLGSYSSGSTSASYVYDPFGRRIRKTVGSTVTWFLWNGSSILAEFNGSGTRERRREAVNPWAHGQVAIGASLGTEAVYGIHADRLETPKLLTTSSGTIVWKSVHEAFGRAHVDEDPDGNTSSISFTERFPGQTFDAETGAHYNYFRTYDPIIGRYLEGDPLGLGSGLNSYAYVEGNPTNFIDPEGLFLTTVDAACARHPHMCAAAFGAATSAATSAGIQYARKRCVDPKTVLRDAAVGGLLGGVLSRAGPLAGGWLARLWNSAGGTGGAAATSALQRASSAAFHAAEHADEFAVGAKHLPGAGGGYAKFAEGIDPNTVLREALTSPSARFLPNDSSSFKIVTDLGYEVGSKGQTAVRAIVDYMGNVVTWFPVR